MKSISNHIFIFIFILFFSNCQKETLEKPEVTILLETTKSWNGNTLPKFPEGQPKVTISKVVIPPKAKLPKHLHPVITTGVLLKGELTVTDDKGKKTTIRQGDVLVEVTDTVHFGENTGSETAEILVFYVGEENEPTTILANK